MKIPTTAKSINDVRRFKSPIRQIMDYARPQYFKELGLDPEKIISFVGGWVNHNAPENLRLAYQEIVADQLEFHASGAYSPTLGFDSCRSAVVKFETSLYNLAPLSANNVAIGASSTQLTYALFSTLLDPEDRVLVLDPAYCNLPLQIFLSRNSIDILRFPVLDPASWSYDERSDEIYDFIQQHRPKLVLLISPDNPTSRVLSDKFFDAALTACENIGSFLVLDSAYKELTFESPYPEYYKKGPTDNFIQLRSNSKWCRGLGRRLGWVLAPEFVISAMDAFLSATVLAPDTLHQLAFSRFVERAVSDGSLSRYIADTTQSYRTAAHLVQHHLKTHGRFKFVEPQGGLYVVANVGRDGAHFVEQALAEKSVLCVPGWGFGRTLTNGVRISYGPLVKDLNKIEEGITRLCELAT